MEQERWRAFRSTARRCRPASIVHRESTTKLAVRSNLNGIPMCLKSRREASAIQATPNNRRISGGWGRSGQCRGGFTRWSVGWTAMRTMSGSTWRKHSWIRMGEASNPRWMCWWSMPARSIRCSRISAQNPRKVLRRTHRNVPVGAVAEMDGRTLRWLSKQPGRDTAERAGIRQTVLAPVREEDLDTLENRALRAVADLSTRLVGGASRGRREAGIAGSEKARAVGRVSSAMSDVGSQPAPAACESRPAGCFAKLRAPARRPVPGRMGRLAGAARAWTCKRSGMELAEPELGRVLPVVRDCGLSVADSHGPDHGDATPGSKRTARGKVDRVA